MQVGQAARRARRDLDPRRPVHHRPSPTMEVVVQRVVGDVVVDEEAVVLGDAVADEGDEVAVVHAADDLHLRLELALALSAAALELLHGHHLAVAERTLEHAPEPALAKDVLAREPAGDVVQLVERERLGVAHAQVAGRRRRHAPRRALAPHRGAVVGRRGPLLLAVPLAHRRRHARASPGAHAEVHRPRRRRRPQERRLAGQVLRRVGWHGEAGVVTGGLLPFPPLRQADEHASEPKDDDHHHDRYRGCGSGAQPAAAGRRWRGATINCRRRVRGGR
jgi:hypothetical protein